MFTEQFFQLLLDFGEDWKVSGVVTDQETLEVDIEVEYIGSESLYDHAPERRWRHLNTMQYRTFIKCCLPRVEGLDGKVKTLTPPWASSYDRHTRLFEIVVIDVLQATKNQTATANLMGCKFDLVNPILHKSVKRGMAKRELVEEAYEQLSIDEKSFKRGHQYVSVLSEPLSGSVLEVVEGRTKKAAQELITKGVPTDLQTKVKEVCVDMWEGFITAIGEKLPQAQIVHDKFHLIKYLNEAMDKVRRRESKDEEELKNSRYALLKNKENLTDKQKIKLDEIKQKNYEVSQVWQERETFKQMFVGSTFEESEIIYQHWTEAIEKSEIKELQEVVKTFSGHLSGVIKGMISGLTNAMAERLNGKIQLIKTVGRGYRRFENFRSAILFFYGNLDLYPLNSR
jgi:transposase